jgi:hypothetical protein
LTPDGALEAAMLIHWRTVEEAMMKHLLCSVWIVFASCSIAAAEFPEWGACKLDVGLSSPLSIVWYGEEADIAIGEDKYTSETLDFRKNGDAFRFTAKFKDEKLNLREILVLAYIDQGVERYRIASVSYEETVKGERIIRYISSFYPAVCRVTSYNLNLIYLVEPQILPK